MTNPLILGAGGRGKACLALINGIDMPLANELFPQILKPVLSNEYINNWHNSIELIRNANKIVIADYSFNYTDEHFRQKECFTTYTRHRLKRRILQNLL
jgi:hypothetical protein